MPFSSHSVVIRCSRWFLCGNETDTAAFLDFFCGKGAIFTAQWISLFTDCDTSLPWLWGSPGKQPIHRLPSSSSGHTYSSCAGQFPVEISGWLSWSLHLLSRCLSVAHCLRTPVKCTLLHNPTNTPFWYLLLFSVLQWQSRQLESTCAFSWIGSHPTYNVLFGRARIPLTF